MSIKLHKKIDLIHRDVLPSSCIHLLRIIVNDVDWKTGRGFKLGVDRCADATNLSRRTIIRALKVFKGLYLIKCTRKHCARRCISAMYTLNLDVLDALVVQSKIIRMHRQTQMELDREENLKKACGKPVYKPLLGDKMAPTLGDKMAPSSLPSFHFINTGIPFSVDNSKFQEGVANEHYREESQRASALFLLECEKNDINIGNALDRYKEYIPDRIAA